MMRKTFFGIVALASIVASPAAWAESWYVGGYGGLNYGHDANSSGGDLVEYDFPGFAIGGFAGMRFNPHIRFEGELTYRTTDISTINGVGVAGDMASMALVASGYYDFSKMGSFTPYAGGGLGIVDAEFTTGGGQWSDTVLALQLGAGAIFDLSPGLAASIDYRLLIADDLALGAGGGFGQLEYTNSSFLVGIRKSF